MCFTVFMQEILLSSKIAGMFTVMKILSFQQVYQMVERGKGNTVS